jgi:hypothetical protein
LGAPHHDSALRYYLNPLDGRVLLAQLDPEKPQLEVVNSSLGGFIEFLYRIGRFKAFSRDADENLQADYKDLLVAYLAARDPHSLQDPENWWSMVVDRL